jgi:hypothetical protein
VSGEQLRQVRFEAGRTMCGVRVLEYAGTCRSRSLGSPFGDPGGGSGVRGDDAGDDGGGRGRFSPADCVGDTATRGAFDSLVKVGPDVCALPADVSSAREVDVDASPGTEQVESVMPFSLLMRTVCSSSPLGTVPWTPCASTGRREGQKRIAPRGTPPSPLCTPRAPTNTTRTLRIHTWSKLNALESFGSMLWTSLACAKRSREGLDLVTKLPPHKLQWYSCARWRRVGRGGAMCTQHTEVGHSFTDSRISSHDCRSRARRFG